ncbi:DNA translocase FtsK [Fictibacillus barbaricus]|uniref:DNA translocase FtsK n=1 Tax=Fictibacillus barbaricus TaxID=182136 RepID=A0ABS2ZEM0_9BACL|nr:DNA translocase FtsK [Fictibacillus barbaricus]MBN3545788.1 DNA translocase FtsK [Fictibacillus barbaricus]GGB56086.1 DNA translocase SpoIIIE [Fictibacillus barbaricus]
MAKNKKKKAKNKGRWKEQLTFEIAGLSLLALASLGLAKMGNVGMAFVHLLRFFSGEWYGVLLLGCILISFYLIWKRSWPLLLTKKLAGAYILFFSFLVLSHLTLFEHLTNGGEWKDASVIRNTWDLYWLQLQGETSTNDLGGGIAGAIGFALFYFLFGAGGTKLVIFFLIIGSLLLISGKSLSVILQKLVDFTSHASAKMKEFAQEKKTAIAAGRNTRVKEKKALKPSTVEEDGETEEIIISEEPVIEDFTKRVHQTDSGVQLKFAPQVYGESEESDHTQDESKDENVSVPSPLPPNFGDEVIQNEHYQLPTMKHLRTPQNSGQHKDKQYAASKSNAKKLEKTFESFGVKAKVLKVHLGPAVTKYEVYPDVGVKVSKIVNLTDDLALALAAKDIRIEAPIPGKSAVGIEVPNQEISMVTLREVLEAPQFTGQQSPLAIGLGRDISGEPIIADLSKMPHLLVAGATGSGKSVCVNGIITSILMRAKPHEVKMMMIDPKMVELNMYNGIPHLLAPVVTEPKKAAQALKRVVSEMERRYELFSHSGTRNIEGYNESIRKQNAKGDAKQPFLPYIVVIVDELADLMMVASGDVEDAITRLAQMARAAGIHLIIATQRPSVDVITGVIKANIPSRIAFSVSSQTDSRTILDMGGAEKLLGRGDMLFFPSGASKPVRVQGAFLSDEEVETIVDHCVSQQRAQYQKDMIPTEEAEPAVMESEDDLFSDAVRLVVDMQTASVSMLQRRFRIGYSRAARLIDTMESKGIVGPYEGSKPREVLISAMPDEKEASSS